MAWTGVFAWGEWGAKGNAAWGGAATVPARTPAPVVARAKRAFLGSRRGKRRRNGPCRRTEVWAGQQKTGLLERRDERHLVVRDLGSRGQISDCQGCPCSVRKMNDRRGQVDVVQGLLAAEKKGLSPAVHLAGGRPPVVPQQLLRRSEYGTSQHSCCRQETRSRDTARTGSPMIAQATHETLCIRWASSFEARPRPS